MTEISNPYRPGEPVANPEGLYGRHDAADWIEFQIVSGTRAMLLGGRPYIGKTSFVRNAGALLADNYVNLTVSMPEALTIESPEPVRSRRRSPAVVEPDLTIETVLERFFEQLIPQLSLHDLISAEQASSRIYPTAATLRILFAQFQVETDQRVVLYIDDLDHLITADMALLATFLSAFMPVIDECPFLYLVFTANENSIKQIRHPLLDNAPLFNLTTLSPDASVNLITQPVRNILRFDYGITRRIAEVNSHHPYYLNLFCHTLLNRQVHDGWVNQRDFDSALTEVLATPIEPFQQIWEQTSWVERAVMAGMAKMQGKHGPMMQQEIVRFLQRLDSSVAEEVVIQALKSLAQKGVLIPMGAISFRFHVELLRLWLNQHTQPAEILQRVDWSRLAAQVQQQPKQDRAITPPLAVQARPRRSVGRMLVSSFLLITVLGCVSIIGLFAATQFFGMSVPFVTSIAAPPAAPDAADPDVVTFTDAGESQVQAEAVTATTEAAPAPTATPTPALVVARTLPSITYMGRDVDQDWRVYTMNADGSGANALSEDGLDDTSPVWSPNGQQIALVSRRDGNREIYVMDVETRNAVNISRHPADDWTPAWSPDGSQLAFSSFRDGGWEIYRVDVACFARPETCAENFVQITSDGSGNISPVWSPDGSRFAFNSKSSGNWDIYTMATDGSDVRQVTTAAENDLSPAWSPDGSQIAFESKRDGNVEIYVIDSNGVGPARNVTNLSFADDHGPTWAPDGQSILFYSNREGNWDIFSTTLDGQTVINLSQTPERDEQTPAWRP
ncbi:MAG: hypothetical protein R3264_02020 [Anaerolineae bacterium]|nr:hypothetical protein [Anaerolineae bacterium]